MQSDAAGEVSILLECVDPPTSENRLQAKKLFLLRLELLLSQDSFVSKGCKFLYFIYSALLLCNRGHAAGAGKIDLAGFPQMSRTGFLEKKGQL
jgi:hypothetical protein